MELASGALRVPLNDSETSAVCCLSVLLPGVWVLLACVCAFTVCAVSTGFCRGVVLVGIFRMGVTRAPIAGAKSCFRDVLVEELG